MAWRPLQERIDSLPLILAGPILRRVESNSVTVWVALKEKRNVTLEVLTKEGQTVLVSEQETTIELGNKLYVIAITAKPVGPPSGLSPGFTYKYNLRFDDPPRIPQSLTDPGVLDADITYDNDLLPSFALPPEDINDLRIIHGSCRKPHGESKDAFEAIDEIFKRLLEESVDGSIDPIKRPHLLFLTGDQIYADDVADALLYMLRDAEKTLLGWLQPETELLLKESNDLEDDSELFQKLKQQLKPGERADLVEEYAGFTTGGFGKSHLLSLGEYFSMYLFAWSDVLWSEVLPILGDVYPEKTLFFWQKNKFEEEVNALISFRKSISSSVRKLLANIPVYMMFDDHEVTDDWYLNLYWVNQVLGKDLGKQTIQNGLIAYAIFQAWGNTPEEFLEGKVGRELLNNVAQWSQEEKLAPRNKTEIDRLLQEIRKQLSIPEISDIKATRSPDDNSEQPKAFHLPHSDTSEDYVKWHYKIVFGRSKFEVLVVDTRTWRRYSDIEKYPGTIRRFPELLSLEAYKSTNGQNIPEPIEDTSEFSVIVLPAPLIGVPLIEEKVQKFGGKYYSAYTWDSEAWSLQTQSFQRFIGTLATRARNAGKIGKYLILSGDVHYGFSAKVQYWGKDPFEAGPTTSTNEAKFVMAQLTSSSLKNEVDSLTGTLTLHSKGYIPIVDGLPDREEILGWNNYLEGEQEEKIIAQSRRVLGSIPWPITISGNPGIIDFFEEKQDSSDGLVKINEDDKPNWSYRLDYVLADFEKQNKPIDMPTNRQESLQKYRETASNYKDYQDEFGEGKEIVGVNNIGEITFEWNDSQKNVVHRLWWRLEKDNDDLNEPFPLSQFRIPMMIKEEEKPTELKGE